METYLADDADSYESLTDGEVVFGIGGADYLYAFGVSSVMDGGVDDDYLFAYGASVSLIGGDGNDYMFGYSTTTTMVGGEGYDTYYTDGDDVIIETGNDSGDTILTSTATFSLESYSTIEALGADDGAEQVVDHTFTGNILDNSISGGLGDDRLYGRGGNDVLSGGAGGTDTLIGGRGDDVYYLIGNGATVIEREDQGSDRIVTDATNFSLVGLGNVEVLEGMSYLGQTLTGNALDNFIFSGSYNAALSAGETNIIRGRAGNDIMFGWVGADEMFGGSGDDILSSTNRSDTGFDPDLPIVSDSLFGGLGNDALTGGHGNDILNGGAGRDTMDGARGDDTYYVNNRLDVVYEEVDKGFDTIYTTVRSLQLSDFANVEQLIYINAIPEIA